MISSLDLKQLGSRIEGIDRLIVILLAQRTKLALNVEAFKKAHNLQVFRKDKERERLDIVRSQAEGLGLSPDFVHGLFYSIIGESCKQQLIQLQGNTRKRIDFEDENAWYAFLRAELLDLTKEVARTYDSKYGVDFFASTEYRKFESEVIHAEIQKIPEESRILALDLGCATGASTFYLANSFQRAVGYDVSPDMVIVAKGKLGRSSREKVSFENVDLENGIPVPDNSVSFVVMNLGTASDIRNIERLISEAKRVLVPEGRFFFSFYNASAFVYRWEFLPWPLAIAAEINREKNCLDVHLSGSQKVFSVYAHLYTVEEIESFFERGLIVDGIMTYPTIGSVFPNHLLEDDSVGQAVVEMDRALSALEFGAYVIVTGAKH